MDKIPRPVVTPQRYRELETMAMQLAAQLPHDDLGECLIIRDLVGNILRRWVMDERMMQHEARPEKEADGVIIRLQRAD